MSDPFQLAPKEYEILQLLITHGELYGLDMVKRSNSLKRGTVYVLLTRLAEKGFVGSFISDEPSNGPPRRKYKLTALGARAHSAANAAKSVFAGQASWQGA